MNRTLSLPLVDPRPETEKEAIPESSEFPGFVNVYEGSGEVEIEAEAISRRQFMALSVTGLGLATTVGCRRPDLQILPYTKTPEHIVPGLPLYYATCMPRTGGALPLLIESHEGRPTKIEGHPQHPITRGSTDVFAQASILDLYSPDRSREVRHEGKPSTWQAFDRAMTALFGSKQFQDSKGEGLRFLAEDTLSPSLNAVRDHIAKTFEKAVWHTYQPVDDNNLRLGAEMIFGKPYTVRLDLSKAKRILSLGCDFLGNDPSQVPYSHDFAEARRRAFAHEKNPEDGPRLYVVEDTFTITGTMADHRLRLPAGAIGSYLCMLMEAMARKQETFAIPLPAFSKLDVPRVWIDAVAEDLWTHRDDCLIVAGAGQPPIVHALCLRLNQLLGSIAKTVQLHQSPQPPSASITDLVNAMMEDKVSTLVILGGNPVYNAPAEPSFASAMGRVKTTIRLGHWVDETSEVSTWHVPESHFLESWGDAESPDGTHCLVQPLIAPLHETRSALEFLIQLTEFDRAKNPNEAKAKTFELVRKSFVVRSGKKDDDPNLENEFKAYIQRGYLENSAPKPEVPKQDDVRMPKELPTLVAPTIDHNTLEITFHADYSVHDGRYASNAWLMEWPDPITKLVWDNAALVSPKTAEALQVRQGDVVEIEVGSAKIRIPVYVLPGQANYSIALKLGYGKASGGGPRIGRVPSGGGFNVYPLRKANTWFTTGKVRKTGERGTLVVTQEHSTIPEAKEKDIIRHHASPEIPHHHRDTHEHHDDPKSRFQFGYKNSEYRKRVEVNSQQLDREQRQIKEAADGKAEDISYPARLDGHMQWGMVIDLTSCTGCSACVVACQAENNIPVVGKDEVARNREMAWIRLDRYFTTHIEGEAKPTPEDDPLVVSEPMMCQQCEAAPCESVCPVNATVHSPEGVNLQVYNRCIGTRYCSNNCPYKVRRFNWFDFNKRRLDELRVPTPFAEGGVPETLKMQKNPDVTVRMRGVMEKCTYCVQRIERGKQGAKVLASKAGMDRVDSPATTSAEQEYALGFGVRQYGAQARVIVPDGVITPACAQACPSKAIVFGNVNDEKSKVFQLKNSRHPEDFLVLGSVNTKPRTSYLPRLRNRNPKMEAGA